MKQPQIFRLLAYAAFAAAAAAIWLAYRQPGFALWLGTSAWLCT
jgi:hypothetical protein